MMKKNLPEFVKYIFPSSKDETRVWFLQYGDHLRFVGISRNNVNVIVLVDKICTIIAKSLTRSLRERLTTKVPPVIIVFWAFAKKPGPEF
jgi:hypothetical protein